MISESEFRFGDTHSSFRYLYVFLTLLETSGCSIFLLQFYFTYMCLDIFGDVLMTAYFKL